ncbi:hypothetical protein BU16DRAFT_161236 [Lophium mytilinum]|uniref:Uncharacterized protein n=1 Tax=Lophium mytilinum TaxID=390894 RepID=A0A6A6QC90_9PEZI|nr:hypothetical protein BU16DRAFT_161236 [Lophium mytilinum]
MMPLTAPTQRRRRAVGKASGGLGERAAAWRFLNFNCSSITRSPRILLHALLVAPNNSRSSPARSLPLGLHRRPPAAATYRHLQLLIPSRRRSSWPCSDTISATRTPRDHTPLPLQTLLVDDQSFYTLPER